MAKSKASKGSNGVPPASRTIPYTVRIRTREWIAIQVVAEIRGMTPNDLYRAVPLDAILGQYDKLVASAKVLHG